MYDIYIAYINSEGSSRLAVFEKVDGVALVNHIAHWDRMKKIILLSIQILPSRD